MSWLSSFMHPGEPYKKAQEQLDKYYNQSQAFNQPYNQNGLNQGQNIQEMIQKLMNPQSLYDEWSKGYEKSEGARQAEGLANESGLNAASSMGLMGSSPALQAIQGGTAKIGLDERKNYLSDLMDKYKMGAGLSQGMYNTGANAANNEANTANSMGTNSAAAKFGESQAPGAAFGNVLSMIQKMMKDMGSVNLGNLGLGMGGGFGSDMYGGS